MLCDILVNNMSKQENRFKKSLIKSVQLINIWSKSSNNKFMYKSQIVKKHQYNVTNSLTT